MLSSKLCWNFWHKCRYIWHQSLDGSSIACCTNPCVAMIHTRLALHAPRLPVWTITFFLFNVWLVSEVRGKARSMNKALLYRLVMGEQYNIFSIQTTLYRLYLSIWCYALTSVSITEEGKIASFGVPVTMISWPLVLQDKFSRQSSCVISLRKEYAMVCFAWEHKLISLGCFYITFLSPHTLRKFFLKTCLNVHLLHRGLSHNSFFCYFIMLVVHFNKKQ